MNPAEFGYIAAAEERMWWFRGMRAILYALLDPLAGDGGFGRVLEAGCGTGTNARALHGRYGWEITALDLAAEGLAHARRAGTARLVQANATALPFAAGSFGLVLSLDVLAHLERGEEREALREFARVLRPGGWVVVRCSALDALRSRHSEFVNERQRFTKRRLTQSLEACGFAVRRATYANSLLLPVAWAKFRLWEPWTRAAADSGVQVPSEWLNGALRTPLAVEAALIRRGINWPLGQTVIALAQRA
jgi:SAM-dependent methyltransferase